MKKFFALLLMAGALSACPEKVVVVVSDSATEACFRSAINVERVKRKIPALRDNTRMDEIASAHSVDMAKDGTIYHNTNLPNEPGVKPFLSLGENVGMGGTCMALHAAFMDSPGHRANILDRDYADLGLGSVFREGTIYVTQVFYTGAEPAPPPTKKQAPAQKKPTPKCTCPQ